MRLKSLLPTLSWGFFLGVLSMIGNFFSAGLALYYEAEIGTWGVLAWSLFFLLMAILMTFSFISNTFISLIAGYFLGLTAIFPLWLTYLLAATVGYFFSKKIEGGKVAVQLSQHKKWESWQKNLHAQGLKLVFWARLSPLLPFAVMNLFLVSQKINFRDYFWGSSLGSPPRMLLTLWIGTQAPYLKNLLESQVEQGFSQAQMLSLTLSILAIAGLFWTVYKIFTQK
ncbi:TVP38/TMEM64 family protein [Hugenholtzia roseola]|uniref:TVP38/TMEM64 family protein n=1 Tax=Hugenholtzia roseola TaxID=1002 RepID=UPI0004798410|nr:VTT domain-containing protein [Hugenholtzia roseola]